MELGLYLYVSKINQTSFAKVLGCNRCYLNQIINKRTRPSEFLAKLIESQTQGVVTAQELRSGIEEK